MIFDKAFFNRRGLFSRLGTVGAAAFFAQRGASEPISFADKDRYPDGSISFTKALPHNALGAVEQGSFQQLRKALETRDPKAFEQILLGHSIKLANPQAAFASDIAGPTPASITIPAPPLFSSDEQAAELVELYWRALARDIHFAEYDTHPIIQAACKDLSRFPGFTGPREGGRVTPRTIFRGHGPGGIDGPQISQLLLRDIEYGVYKIPQKLASPQAGLDYCITYDRWLATQNGEIKVSDPHEPLPRYYLEAESRFTRNGRDLTEIVHRDFTYQAFLNAALILLTLKAPFDRGNPYRWSRSQAGFCTFGECHLLEVIAQVASCALKACWYQKWAVFLRLRPEEFAGRVHLQMKGTVDYPISATLRSSEAMQRIYDQYGTYLLPQAYPEGCPTHPSYPAGHAVVAGACSTVIKAFFDESFEIRDTVMASPDGRSLEPYSSPALRLGGEMNKLAYNIAFGRDFAGIHWRSDGEAGIALGERVAIEMLSSIKANCNEKPCHFSLTKFDGSTIVI